MEVYRGDSASKPSLGTFSYWSDSKHHASIFAGFHLPAGEDLALYLADITPARLLDLRSTDPWMKLLDETGIDLCTKVGQRQDLVHDRLSHFAAAGFDWLARFADYTTNDRPHRPDGLEEWIYLGDDEVPATLIGALPNEWK